MICPVCGVDNLTGAEVCDNCGADLGGHDIPQPAVSFQGRLLGAHLDALQAPAPITVDPETSLASIVGLMHAQEADCVLVVDDGRLVGIFTDRDAVLKATDGRLEDRRVADLMTPDPVVLRHDDPIAVAIHKMAVGGFRHIPIVEDGVPTGVVTARDVFAHLARSLA
jgi:CBS domain-containing protein